MSWWKPDPIDIDLSKYGVPGKELSKEKTFYERLAEQARQLEEAGKRIRQKRIENIRSRNKKLFHGDIIGYAKLAREQGVSDEEILKSVEMYRITGLLEEER